MNQTTGIFMGFVLGATGGYIAGFEGWIMYISFGLLIVGLDELLDMGVEA